MICNPSQYARVAMPILQGLKQLRVPMTVSWVCSAGSVFAAGLFSFGTLDWLMHAMQKVYVMFVGFTIQLSSVSVFVFL